MAIGLPKAAHSGPFSFADQATAVFALYATITTGYDRFPSPAMRVCGC
jgi:hypothetical protein